MHVNPLLLLLRTEGVSRGVKVHPGYTVAGFGWASYPTFTQYSYRSVQCSTVLQYFCICTCNLLNCTSLYLSVLLHFCVPLCTCMYFSVLLCTPCSGLMRCCCSCGIEPAITICQVSWIRFLRRNLYRYLQISITTIYIYLFCQGEGDGMMKTLEEINVEQWHSQFKVKIWRRLEDMNIII